MDQPIDTLAQIPARPRRLTFPRLSDRAFALGSLTICAALFAVFVFTNYFQYINDDSYIFFRYAINLAQGHGIAYNPGERVEGVTSLAWTVLLAPFALTPHLILGSKLLGLACALITLLAFYKTLDTLVGNRLLVFAGLWMLALNQLFQSWATSGMDIALYVAWQTVFLYLAATGDMASARQRLALVGLTGLGFFVRPDAYLVALIGWAIVGLRFLDDIRSSRRMLTDFVVSLGLVGVLAALPFAFRLWYFGKLLPNTFYAKSFYAAVGGENRLGIRHGLAYITDSFHYIGWTLVWLAVAGLLLSSLHRQSRALPFAVTGLALATYVTLVGGDVLTQRFFLTLVPILIIGFMLALNIFLTGRGGYVAPVVIGLLLAVVLTQSMYQYREAKREPISQVGHLFVKNNSIMTTEADYAAGVYLARHAAPGEVLLTDNIGGVGYASGLRVIDSYGLVSPQIADLIFRGSSTDQVLDALLSSEADWFLCNYSVGPDGQRTYTFYIAGAGFDVTRWVADHNYREVSTWESQTWYRRALLRRD